MVPMLIGRYVHIQLCMCADATVHACDFIYLFIYFIIVCVYLYMHMYNFLYSDSLLYFFLFLSTLHSVYTRDCSCSIE